MNENYEKVNKIELFKSYNNFSEENISSIIKEYDEKYVKSLNSLSTLISNFISNTKSYLIAISKVCLTLKNQINYSQFLIEEIQKKREKYSQLCDRIEMINNTSKLLDNHLLISNNNLNIFISEAKKEFKEIKDLRIEKWNKIKNIKNIRNDIMFNKSTSRGKIKKNIYEIEAYNSNDKVYSPHKKENIYNNFIHSSNKQKFNNLIDKQNDYKKIHINQSQENYCQQKIVNKFNKKKCSSVIKEKNSRNKCNTLQNSFSSRNNSSVNVKNTEKSKSKIKRNNLTTEVNSIELKLAYKVLEFIFLINNLQLNRINNNLELKNKIETLKNNLLNLTNEVIKQNKNNKNYKNKNIINNNFIYNNKENLELDEDFNKFNSEERDCISLKINNLYDKIEKLTTKNQDLELLIKIKNKENQKLNKIIHNKQIFQSYQGHNNINIHNNSLEKLSIKNKNNKNNDENNIKQNGIKKMNDIALLLNKKIEDLNKSIEIIKKEKNQLNNDLISKNKTIKDLKEKITTFYNKNKNKLLIIDQKNKIHLFFTCKKVKNDINKQIEDYKNNINNLEKENDELKKELEKEKKKLEKIDTNELVKLHNKMSEYKIKLSYYKDNYKKQEAQILHEKETSSDFNNINKKENLLDIINENSYEEIFEPEIDNNNVNSKNNMRNDNNNLSKENKILKQKINKFENKIKQNNSNIGIDYEKLINNFTKDIKDKDTQIDYLNNQIQKLKGQIENKKDKNIKNRNKKNLNEFESKMLILKEKNSHFLENLNSFDEQIKFNEKDIEQLKNSIHNSNINLEFKITKDNFCFIPKKAIKNAILYSPDKYEILCDKFFSNFHWFLLINKKEKTDIINDFHKMFWAEKRELINIENFNKYISEVDEQNKNIIKYISKLEEKEDIISKLNYKLSQIEKVNSLEDLNINTGSNKQEKLETLSGREKYNLISKIKNLEEEINILKEENIALKENNKQENNENGYINEMRNYNPENYEYNKLEEKLKKGEIPMSDNMKKIINNHFNNNDQEKKDDSTDNNYIQSSNKEDEFEKITEKNESEEGSDSNENQIKNFGANQNKNIHIVRKQLERITKLYEELEKRLKKIKNAVKKIFSNYIIKEKEKEINTLLEICGFTEEEINEFFLYREQ